jgi:hypothetical protein
MPLAEIVNPTSPADLVVSFFVGEASATGGTLCRSGVAATAAEAEDPTDKEDQSNDPHDGVYEPEASKDQCQKQDDQNQSHIVPL